MKTISKLGFVALFLASAASANAQAKKPHENPNYGPDSASRVECSINISLYGEFYKQKNYKDAVVKWREVFNKCPKASENTFIRGASIYKALIADEKDEARKQTLIDTLMLIYDTRIQYFKKQEGSVLGQKGFDLYTYRKESAGEAYQALKKSCEMEKDKSKAGMISTLMQTVVDEYKAEKVDGVEVVSTYELCMNTIDAAVALNKGIAESGDAKKAPSAQKELEALETATNNVEALFSESGAASCDVLINILSAKYDANKDNLDWLKKTTKLLNKAECTDSPLFANASEAQYKLEPSAEAAHNLARLFAQRKDNAKANSYYEQACSLQEDIDERSNYYVEWCAIALDQKNYQRVRDLALKALADNSSNGKANMMIGLAYAQAAPSIGKEDVEHRAVYWAAIDQFNKAKASDPSLTDKVNSFISAYKAQCPKKEEAFMFGISDGADYKIGGWINVTTKARF
ncbi:MAG: hypothetical protein MJ069_09160 [Salinivirgaceae bacterium]|nr:hypothetical protein [Salinivirgaceae bacterium]